MARGSWFAPCTASLSRTRSLSCASRVCLASLPPHQRAMSASWAWPGEQLCRRRLHRRRGVDNAIGIRLHHLALYLIGGELRGDLWERNAQRLSRRALRELIAACFAISFRSRIPKRTQSRWVATVGAAAVGVSGCRTTVSPATAPSRTPIAADSTRDIPPMARIRPATSNQLLPSLPGLPGGSDADTGADDGASSMSISGKNSSTTGPTSSESSSKTPASNPIRAPSSSAVWSLGRAYVLVASSPLAHSGRAAVTRQITFPTSSATSKQPPGPIATPTGRP